MINKSDSNKRILKLGQVNSFSYLGQLETWWEKEIVIRKQRAIAKEAVIRKWTGIAKVMCVLRLNN